MRRKTAHSMFLFTVNRCISDAGMGINCSHCTRRNFCWSCILFCATPNDPYQILWTNEHLSSSSSWRYFQQLILVFFFLIKIKLFIILRILFTVLNFTQTHILLFFLLKYIGLFSLSCWEQSIQIEFHFEFKSDLVGFKCAWNRPEHSSKYHHHSVRLFSNVALPADLKSFQW